jgi:hypothetical protein
MTARLPNIDGDDNDWGTVLNAFLMVSHANDGTLNPNTVGTLQIENNAVTNANLDSSTQTIIASVAGKYVKPSSGIPGSDLDRSTQSSLSLANSALQTAPVSSVAGRTGAVTLAESDINNLTSDLSATEKTANKGAASGYAPLDSNSKLPTGNLPTTIPIANIPTGTTSSTVAIGNDARITGAIQKGSLVFNVMNYGATGNGTTDDTTAIKAAITAASVSGGIVFLPPGTYKVSSVMTINSPAVSILGAGSGATFIRPSSTVTGDVLRVQTNPTTFVNQMVAGRFGWLTIDGTNAGTGAVGLHYGDTIGGCFDDLRVWNFTTTGAIGIHMHNTTFWTERTTMIQTTVENCKVGIEFDVTSPGTNSFEHTMMLDVKMGASTGQTGLLIGNGASIYNGVINLDGNFGGTGTVFVHLNSGTSGVWNNMTCQIHGDGSSGTGLLIEVNDIIIDCTGSIVFADGCNNVANNQYCRFTGHFNCPGITNLQLADTYFVNGHGPNKLGNEYTFGSNLWSGSGLPDAPTGALRWTSVTVGDFYFRFDTPGTSNQRLYVCTASGKPGTWSAIL